MFPFCRSGPDTSRTGRGGREGSGLSDVVLSLPLWEPRPCWCTTWRGSQGWVSLPWRKREAEGEKRRVWSDWEKA